MEKRFSPFVCSGWHDGKVKRVVGVATLKYAGGRRSTMATIGFEKLTVTMGDGVNAKDCEDEG